MEHATPAHPEYSQGCVGVWLMTRGQFAFGQELLKANVFSVLIFGITLRL